MTRLWGSTATKISIGLLNAATITMLLGPLLIILVLSFSNDKFIVFPPHSYGLRYYSEFLGEAHWRNSTYLSLNVSLWAASLATFVAVPAVFAINRSNMPGRRVLELLALSPLLLPGISYAIALYVFYLKAKLVGTFIGVVLADAALGIPFVVVITGAGLNKVPRDLELAAMGLGAGRLWAVVSITLRLLAPSIAAGFLLAFIVAFDEATIINFIGGARMETLPKAIFETIRLDATPVIAAIASMLLVATLILLGVISRLRSSQDAS